MKRVCGAEKERDALSRARCWCGGLFCGPGGAKLSTKLRRAFHPPACAASLSEFEDLIRQADLYDGDALRDEWRARLEAHRPPRVRETS